jgi:phosphoserine phosphatase
MEKIYLIRHGQDTDNAAGILNGRRDTKLTSLGIQQAKQVAQKLYDNDISIIYTSPLKRAYETARIIAEELGIDKIVVDKHLTERDFGILTGKLLIDIEKYTNKIISADKVNYFLEVEGSEDFPSLLKRGKKILKLKKIQKRYPRENIGIVTHGDIGKMIRAAFHNWSWEKGLKKPYFDNTEILELSKDYDIVEEDSHGILSNKKNNIDGSKKK